MSDADGGIQSLLGSIQAHIEERLKSPFGGAFAIAWIAINWKAVLILIASATPIEDRIAVVSTTHFASPWTYLWWPLIYAFGGVLCYYALSTVFVIFYEAYGVLRRFVEQRFDSYRWVAPATYIDMKRESRKKIEELSGFAADQVDAIEGLRAQLSVAESERAAAQLKVEEESKRAEMAKGVAEIQAALGSTLEAETKQLRVELESLSKRFDLLSEAANGLNRASRIVENQLNHHFGKNGQVVDARRRRPIEQLDAARAALTLVLSEDREPA